jgi:hypothetical protein
MKQTFSIKKLNGKWLIFDNTEPLDIPFDDGGEEGFTKEECIQACINLNSVPESDEEEAAREARNQAFNEMIRSVVNLLRESIPNKVEETVFELLAGTAIPEVGI